MYKKIALAAVIGAFIAGCASQQAPEESKKAAAAAKPAPELMTGASAGMLADTCSGCHGTDGASGGPATPTIAGMSEDYLVETMTAYKSGERWSTIMGRIAKGYSDDEIAAMAKHYAALPYKGHTQVKVDSKAKAGHKLHDKYCEKCHEDGASSIEDDSGLLAAQWMPYVHWTIDDYVAGRSTTTEKKMSKALKKMLAEHGPASVENLVHFYGSRK
jgi:sulfide dehydrogenase cytochrome subunit